ncbi:MAG: Dabb family protein [Planctomycetes bacterium]|nr:Dabb family protein [Planctomycetota bacterium]
MLHHHVMFKMRDDKRGEIETFIVKLKKLKQDVPTVREVRVGLNTVKGKKSYDIYYYARFDDAAGFEAYMKHPLHVPVVKYVEEVCSAVADVDVVD